MKQKFLFLVFIIISAMFTKAFAQTVEVKSLSNFTTYNPPASIKVELLTPLELMGNNLTIPAGSEVSGKLVDVVSPKRLKRDASFSFEPNSFKNESGTYTLSEEVKASYTVPIDKVDLAENVAVGVGNFFVKGLSMGVAVVKGAVKNENGNRLKSSAVSVYESSPVSYVEKGKDIEIKSGQIFYLKFPNVKEDDEEKGQNYTYQLEKE